MKKLALLLTVLTALTMTPSFAQKTGQKKIKTLVDYKTELSMTDKQVADIGAALKSFQATITDQRKSLTQYESEYQKLIADHAPLDQVKQKLRQVTDTGFNLRYADVLTSRKVESILSADQLAKWRDIQSKVRATKAAPATP